MNLSLSPERAEQIRHLFREAVERDPDERAAHLHQRCGNDEALRAPVLLEA